MKGNAFAALLSVALTSLAFAQAPTPVRVRGTVEKPDGTNMTVRTASGRDLHGTLTAARVNVGLKGQTPPM
jgi:hypothetical protein